MHTVVFVWQVLTRFDSLRAYAVLLVSHAALHLCEQQRSSGHFLYCQSDSQSPAAV
jgi:hypothetical protein